MRTMRNLLALAALFAPSLALACDYYSAPVGGGLDLTYFPKGTRHYSYSMPVYEADTYSVAFRAPNSETIGPVNLLIHWPEGATPKESLAGTPRWEVLLYWGAQAPPPDGSSIVISGDKTVLARLERQHFPRTGPGQHADMYYPDGPVPDLRPYRNLTVEVITPEGKMHGRLQSTLPFWQRLSSPFNRLTKRLRKLAQSENRSDSKECGIWPIAD